MVEYNYKYEERNKVRIPKQKILSLTPALDSICPKISTYPDYDIRFKNLISNYDFVSVANYIDDPYKASALIIKIVLNDFLDNPSMSLMAIENLFNKYFFSIYDSMNKEHVSIAAKSFIRLTQIHEMIFPVLNQYKHIASNIDFYTTLGIRPRNAYQSCIDAVLVNEKTNDILLINKSSSSLMLNSVINPKVLAALDYCKEASIKISSIFILSYDFVSLERLPLLKQYSVTDIVNQLSTSYMATVFPNRLNISYCGMCPYNSSCSSATEYIKGVY